MRKILIAILLNAILPKIAVAQVIYDSTGITFNTTDSINRTVNWFSITNHGVAVENIHIKVDTSGSKLWQIGGTLKPVFSDTTSVFRGIMTDTLHPYPANADDVFTLHFSAAPTNPTIEIWHEYNTNIGHAGGIIEYSPDTGATWVNVVKCWSIYGANLYQATDTLLTGEPAFMGTEQKQVTSIFFTNCLGEKNAQTNCYTVNQPMNMLIRFRFVSDSLIDSLSGWKIDSFKIITSTCGSAVTNVSRQTQLIVKPSPSYNGFFYLPELNRPDQHHITVYDSRGVLLFTGPYSTTIDISKYAMGLYFYMITGAEKVYRGKLIYE